VSGRVAFLGLGIMGSRMAANLHRAGHRLTVWNRTAARAAEFAAAHAGVRVAPTPAQAAAGAEVAFTMVVDGPQVEQVLLGRDGVADGAAAGLLCVDCSTIGASAARTVAETLHGRGIRFVDAPVTGSAPRAQDATLTIMAGGSPADFDAVRPLLQAMGKLIVHAGPVGHGQLIKVINNAVAAVNAAVVGEALLVGDAAGVNLDALVQVMEAGSGGSAMLSLKSRPMRAHNFAALFKLDHMLKDVRLCLEEAEGVGAPFDFAARAAAILGAASELGHGEDDFAALIEVLEGAAGRRL
jgi:3-hydroxyisobutyrate dehydrogenase-like beta-hydroxyacid dehydrogenase